MIIIELNYWDRKDAQQIFKTHGKKDIDVLYARAFQKRWDLFFKIKNGHIQVSDYFWELSEVSIHIKNQT
jgi:hypothetical protein